MTATDDSGRPTEIVVSGGLISSVTNSAGREWDFDYTDGELTTITDPLGVADYATYDVTGLTSFGWHVGGTRSWKIWGVTYDAGKVSDVWLPILQPFPPKPNDTLAYTELADDSQPCTGLRRGRPSPTPRPPPFNSAGPWPGPSIPGAAPRLPRLTPTAASDRTGERGNDLGHKRDAQPRLRWRLETFSPRRPSCLYHRGSRHGDELQRHQ